MFRKIADWLQGSSPRPLAPVTPPALTPTARRCERCWQPRVIHITEARNGARVREAHLCESCAHRYFSTPTDPEAAHGGFLGSAERQLDVERVIISEIHDQQVLVFREVGGRRSFPLVCGIFEAVSIDRTLKQEPTPRPLTYDAWQSTVTALGGEIECAIISELREQTYFAKLRIRRSGEIVDIDVRPSDAAQMALKARAPILISEALLSEIGQS